MFRERATAKLRNYGMSGIWGSGGNPEPTGSDFWGTTRLLVDVWGGFLLQNLMWICGVVFFFKTSG